MSRRVNGRGGRRVHGFVRLVPLAALLLAACTQAGPPPDTRGPADPGLAPGGGPAARPGPAPAPAPPGDPAPAPEPVPDRPARPGKPAPSRPGSPAIAASCDVELRAELRGSGATRQLAVVAVDVTGKGVTFELPDRCPSGAIDFTGLGAGYDYYGTCNAGACPGPGTPTRVTLAPGEAREVARASLELGGGTCTKPLAAGTYEIRPVAPDPAMCVVPARLQVGAAPTPKPPAKDPPPKPTPPKDPPQDPPPDDPAPADPPAPAYSGDPRACTQDSDCIIYCPRVQGCCGFPCGCKNAINKAAKDAFTASYAKSCERHPNCPAVGCAREDASWARCERGRCVAQTSLTF